MQAIMVLAFWQLILAQPSDVEHKSVEPKAPTVLPAPEPAPEPSQVIKVTRGIKYIDRKDAIDHFTSLDVYQPTDFNSDTDTVEPRPILIYVHGGGWAIGDKSRVHEKPQWAIRNGWILVSVNYRLSPQVMHPEHARDVAAAVAYVIQNATDFGGDPDQIVLMGHSAGAHLAAIVACDETLLGQHDLSPSDIAGVVLLDGAGYDIPTTMKNWMGKKARAMYEQAFGDDPKLWIQASPTLQATPKDTLAPLIAIHAGNRIRSQIAATDLAKAWKESGTQATVHHAPDKDHAGINQLMGIQNDPDTQVVEKFIQAVFANDQ